MSQAPHVTTVTTPTDAVAASADAVTIVARAGFDGTVTAVSYTPEANITGNDAESRAFSLVNKGQDGNGTTVVATLDMATGVDMTDYNETALTLSAVADATDVADGDILAFTSTHEGSTGLADPGGLVRVTLSRG